MAGNMNPEYLFEIISKWKSRMREIKKNARNQQLTDARNRIVGKTNNEDRSLAK